MVESRISQYRKVLSDADDVGLARELHKLLAFRARMRWRKTLLIIRWLIALHKEVISQRAAYASVQLPPHRRSSAKLAALVFSLVFFSPQVVSFFWLYDLYCLSSASGSVASETNVCFSASITFEWKAFRSASFCRTARVSYG